MSSPIMVSMQKAEEKNYEEEVQDVLVQELPRRLTTLRWGTDNIEFIINTYMPC